MFQSDATPKQLNVTDIEAEIKGHFGQRAQDILSEFRATHKLAPKEPIPQKLAPALEGTKAAELACCVCWQCLDLNN